jgi:hypothetical protein
MDEHVRRDQRGLIATMLREICNAEDQPRPNSARPTRSLARVDLAGGH